jgi:hypothetical protein
MERYAELRVCSPRDKVIEQLYVSPRCDTIENLQREVMMAVQYSKIVAVLPILICTVDVRAMVKQPIQGLPFM